jgi:hypothetical protein
MAKWGEIASGCFGEREREKRTVSFEITKERAKSLKVTWLDVKESLKFIFFFRNEV